LRLETAELDGFPLDAGELDPLLPDDVGFDEGFEFEVGELGAVDGFPLETVAVDGFLLETGMLDPFPEEDGRIDDFPLEMVDPFPEEGELDGGADDF